MNVSEEYQEVHSDAPPVRRVVDVSLTEMPGESSLLVCLVYQGHFDSARPGLVCLLLDKVLREDEPLQLGDLAVRGSWEIVSGREESCCAVVTILPSRCVRTTGTLNSRQAG